MTFLGGSAVCTLGLYAAIASCDTADSSAKFLAVTVLYFGPRIALAMQYQAGIADRANNPVLYSTRLVGFSSG
ncbi:hypothetical protein BS47DRAFT_473246 [Hydnum rufescens UP504]|uniref:Uncharacterized protein n=1 Tax=Hydnum rufescens UP504 TaxID=1448309 RepID=A0A9P6B4U2_9AGAM|nr:hypothetical protein BS47DRAFT_473246 [Hydnum rufescens UP504]